MSDQAEFETRSASQEEPGGLTARSDPRQRPADPAGTQPKFDPSTLEPIGEFRALPVGKATSEAGSSSLLELVEPAEPPALQSQGTGNPHGPRFQFLLGTLGALGLTAIVLAVYLALAPSPKPGVPWSSWKPSGNADPATQIAAHVEAGYELSPGRRLVGVAGGPQAIGGQPVVVALRTSGSAPAQLGENGVFYQLCGDGPSCSIPGKASRERAMLVTREALELALYTFHYIGGASQVVVTFPPLPPSSSSKGSTKTNADQTAGLATTTKTTATIGASGPPSHVLLFRPSDLSQELAAPLNETLSESAPTVKTVASAPETPLIGELTANLLYDSVLVPESQASSVLLLQRPSIGG